MPATSREMSCSLLPEAVREPSCLGSVFPSGGEASDRERSGGCRLEVGEFGRWAREQRVSVAAADCQARLRVGPAGEREETAVLGGGAILSPRLPPLSLVDTGQRCDWSEGYGRYWFAGRSPRELPGAWPPARDQRLPLPVRQLLPSPRLPVAPEPPQRHRPRPGSRAPHTNLLPGLDGRVARPITGLRLYNYWRALAFPPISERGRRGGAAIKLGCNRPLSQLPAARIGLMQRCRAQGTPMEMGPGAGLAGHGFIGTWVGSSQVFTLTHFISVLNHLAVYGPPFLPLSVSLSSIWVLSTFIYQLC